MYTAVSLRATILCQTEGPSPVAGTRRDLRRSPVRADDDSVSRQFLISNSPRTQTRWRNRALQEKQPKEFIPFFTPTQRQQHPKATSSPSSTVLLLLATAVTVATDGSITQ